MLKNKILKRYFFIKKDDFTYCGKCGKKQLQDCYNLKKHAKECGFSTDIEPKIFNDGADYAYSFQISKNGEELHFYVFSYALTLRRGFKDRYDGSEWTKVFQATFKRDGSREVKEKGLYNIDTWMKMMIDQKHIPSLSADEDNILIGNFFSDIIDIESMGAFLDIYRNKGYGNITLNETKVCELLEINELTNTIKNKVNKRTSLKSVTASASNHNIDGKLCILLNLNCIFQEKDSPVFSESIKILISSGYMKSNYDCSNVFRLLLQNKYTFINKIKKKTLLNFDESNPNFMVKQYIENGGENIFIPLLASNYDKCLELLYKAGIPVLAEKFFEIKKKNHLVFYKNNLKDIFGLPIKTLKKISSPSFALIDGLFNRLAEIYQYSPKLLSLESYGLADLTFLMCQNVTHKNDFVVNHNTVFALNNLSEDESFRTIKYLNKIEHKNADGIDIWNLYSDYLNMCQKLKDMVFGLYPSNLKQAHDTVAELIFQKQNKEMDEAFKYVIKQDFYKNLVTTEKDFKEDEYIIISPKSAYDLVRESAEMNNCVKTYIDKVCRGQTMIYFLRNRQEIQKSLCTIEVLPSGTIIQAKTKGNSKPNEDICQFVYKWAKLKSLSISTYDLR